MQNHPRPPARQESVPLVLSFGLTGQEWSLTAVLKSRENTGEAILVCVAEMHLNQSVVIVEGCHL